MFKRRLLLMMCVLGLLLSMVSCGGADVTETKDEPEKEATVEKEETQEKQEEKEQEEPKEEEEEAEKEEESNKNDKSEEEEKKPAKEDKKPAKEDKKEESSEDSDSDREQSKPSSSAGTSGGTTSNWSSANLTAEEIEALLNDPYMILVNRQNKVTSEYKPNDLVSCYDERLNKTCADALKQLMNEGKKAGYNYVLYSGYRTYNTQYNKYYNKIAYYKDKGYSEEKAIELTDQYYAQPGASEHHTGLAADVCIPRIVNKYACLHEAYGETEEFKWFSTHAHEYGFILRYGETQSDITGYNYEPWHYRYVGVDVASEIYRRGITYEEFIWELQDRLAELKK